MNLADGMSLPPCRGQLVGPAGRMEKVSTAIPLSLSLHLSIYSYIPIYESMCANLQGEFG